MAKELTIHLDLSFKRRSFVTLLTSLVLLMTAAELGSESVTLTTYYPAPSGVYTQMITTGKTLLARDGTSVSIGSAYANNAANIAQLYVSAAGSGMGLYVGNGVPGATGAGQSYYEQGGPAGIHAWITENGVANPVFAMTPGGSVHVGGLAPGYSAAPRGYLYIDNTNTGCVATTPLPNTAPCGAAQYASWTPGLYINGTSYQGRSGPPIIVDYTKPACNVPFASMPAYCFSYTVSGLIPNSNPGDANYTIAQDSARLGTVWCCPK